MKKIMTTVSVLALGLIAEATFAHPGHIGHGGEINHLASDLQTLLIALGTALVVLRGYWLWRKQ
jgi:hypothetical protein